MRVSGDIGWGTVNSAGSWFEPKSGSQEIQGVTCKRSPFFFGSATILPQWVSNSEAVWQQFASVEHLNIKLGYASRVIPLCIEHSLLSLNALQRCAPLF